MLLNVCSFVLCGDKGEGVFIGKMVLSRLLLEFKVRGCNILGVDDIRDGFDKVYFGLFCWGFLVDGFLEGEVGGIFFCLVEVVVGKRR